MTARIKNSATGYGVRRPGQGSDRTPSNWREFQRNVVIDTTRTTSSPRLEEVLQYIGARFKEAFGQSHTAGCRDKRSNTIASSGATVFVPTPFPTANNLGPSRNYLHSGSRDRYFSGYTNLPQSFARRWPSSPKNSTSKASTIQAALVASDQAGTSSSSRQNSADRRANQGTWLDVSDLTKQPNPGTESCNIVSLLYNLLLTARNCNVLFGTLAGLPGTPRPIRRFSFPRSAFPDPASLSIDPTPISFPRFTRVLWMCTCALPPVNRPHLEVTFLHSLSLTGRMWNMKWRRCSKRLKRDRIRLIRVTWCSLTRANRYKLPQLVEMGSEDGNRLDGDGGGMRLQTSGWNRTSLFAKTLFLSSDPSSSRKPRDQGRLSPFRPIPGLAGDEDQEIAFDD